MPQSSDHCIFPPLCNSNISLDSYRYKYALQQPTAANTKTGYQTLLSQYVKVEMNSMYLCYPFSKKLETDNEQSSKLREWKAIFSPHHLLDHHPSHAA